MNSVAKSKRFLFWSLLFTLFTLSTLKIHSLYDDVILKAVQKKVFQSGDKLWSFGQIGQQLEFWSDGDFELVHSELASLIQDVSRCFMKVQGGFSVNESGSIADSCKLSSLNARIFELGELKNFDFRIFKNVKNEESEFHVPSYFSRIKTPASMKRFLLSLVRIRGFINDGSESFRSGRYLYHVSLQALHESDIDLLLPEGVHYQKLFPQPYLEIVGKLSSEFEVSRGLIYSVMRAESMFDPLAKSHAGACGVMQIMPETANSVLGTLENSLLSRYELKGDYSQVNCELLQEDVNLSLVVGVVYLSRLMDRFDGNLDKVLAAYNAGPGRVIQWQSRSGSFFKNVRFEETRNYLKKVGASMRVYEILYP